MGVAVRGLLVGLLQPNEHPEAGHRLTRLDGPRRGRVEGDPLTTIGGWV